MHIRKRCWNHCVALFLCFSIFSYVTSEKGIRGILKDSCDDFIVQEINKDGQIVELKNTECPAGILNDNLLLQCRLRRRTENHDSRRR